MSWVWAPQVVTGSLGGGGGGPVVLTPGFYFADFTEEDDFLDWDQVLDANSNFVTGSNYVSFLETHWATPEDIMFWAQTPYVYSFIKNQGTKEVIENGEVTGTTRVDGLTMIAKWDWKE